MDYTFVILTMFLLFDVWWFADSVGKMKSKAFSLIIIGLVVFSCFLVVLPTVKAAATWTYNAGTNTATFAGAGGGSTNFAALVAADVAGGWGKYTADASGKQIKCTGKIILGDGINTVDLTDTAKQLYFTAFATANWQNMIELKDKATLTLGTLTDATSHYTQTGVEIYIYSTYLCYAIKGANTANCVLNLYSSIVLSYITAYIYNFASGNIWNTGLTTSTATFPL